MNAAPNSRAYKVISLLIKAGILILSFWYVFYKLKNTSVQLDFSTILKQSDKPLLAVTFCLLFINWGLEALKWKLLIAPLENISFLTAFKSVFAGVTVSIFMPNRVGEFAGRIFFLEKAGKVEATLKNFVGAIAQFSITFCVGGIAMFHVSSFSGSSYADDHFKITLIIQLIAMLMVLGIILFILLNRLRLGFSSKVQSCFNAVSSIGWKELVVIFILSFTRYCVFLFQYYLAIKVFGVRMDFEPASLLIAIVFLITSAIPSFALTEVVTRGAVAATVFGLYCTDTNAVIAASFMVWIINLAIPALTGSLFIGKMKFFKS